MINNKIISALVKEYHTFKTKKAPLTYAEIAEFLAPEEFKDFRKSGKKIKNIKIDKEISVEFSDNTSESANIEKEIIEAFEAYLKERYSSLFQTQNYIDRIKPEDSVFVGMADGRPVFR